MEVKHFLRSVLVLLISGTFAFGQMPASGFVPGTSTPQGASSAGSTSSFGQNPAANSGTTFSSGFRGSNYQPPSGSLKTADQSSFATTTTQKISWIDGSEFSRAVKIAQQTGKPLLLHFWNEHCAPCMRLEQAVFPNPQVVQAINSQFIPVKVNTIATPELHRTYGVSQWPWDVFVTPGGKSFLNRKSPDSAQAYIQHLNSAANLQRNFSKFASATKPSEPALGSAGGAPSSVTQMVANNLQAPPSTVNSPKMYGGGNSAPPSTVRNQFYNKSNPAPANVASTAKYPVGLEGKCPVSLTKDKEWISGNSQFGCNHRGRLYFFRTKEYRDLFMSDPDRFAPVLAGFDVVEFRESGKLIDGKNKIGIFAGMGSDKRVYRFSSKKNLEMFQADSGRYTEAVRIARQNADAKYR